MRGASVLVAVSGGPDSIALLHILLSLREKLNLRLALGHVNYGLRGVDSDLDERLVRDYAETYELPIFVYCPRNAKGKNEAMLRDIRYRFFERIATEERCDIVATAHTEDDQAETILIRLLRGTGHEGLAGIRPRRDRYIRPLLGRTKAELVRFLKDENLSYREDASNHDTDILRNRIRHELLPLLERNYQKGIRKTLARTAEHLSIADTTDTPKTLATLSRETNGVSFSRREFLSCSKTQQTEVLRCLFRELSGSGYAPPTSFARETMKLLESRKNKAQHLTFGQLKITARGDRVGMIRSSY